MPRGRKKGVKIGGYLMSNEFKVEVQREGWERVANLLRGVDFGEFLSGSEIRLDFNETKDLDVLAFFVKWALSKETADVVIKLGSGKRELLFSSCWVDSVIMDGFLSLKSNSNSGSDKTGDNVKNEVVGVAMILRYTAAFVKEKTV
jgi:hypothetical protein